MSTYRLAVKAQRDLDQIWSYIADDNPIAADRVIDEMHAAFRRLARMPGLGHTRADITDPRYRFWPVYSYLIVYSPDTSPLQIVRVVSGVRNLAPLFE